MLDSEQYKGHTIELHSDEDAENPRTAWDNITEMICIHKRYQLGDVDHGYEFGPYADWNTIQDILFDPDPDKCTAAAWLPLYLYDHSGLTVNTTGFNCGWDSMKIGFIRITKEAAAEHYADWPTSKLEEILVSDVETYDVYLRGEVVGYIIKDAAGNEIEDGSCWGYYSHEDAIAEAKSVIDHDWQYKHALFAEAGVAVEVPA